LGVRWFPDHITQEDRQGGFFIQAQASFDFTLSENIRKSTGIYYDPRTNFTHKVPPPPDVESIHSDKFRAQRISPSILVGQEIRLDNVSMYYGGLVEFTPAYQFFSLTDDRLNWKCTLFSFGMDYRF
jgi:hypothetical protein